MAESESIDKKRLDDIATWMISVKPTNLPSVLKGVFFMDGNPLPDVCMTMYNLEWDSENRTLFLPVFGPRQWTFHDSIAGLILLRSAQLTQFTYKIEFEDDTLQKAHIVPLALGLPIPRWILDLKMYQDPNNNNGDTWQRKNFWFGGVLRIGEYILRRVVDENGNYTPAFKDMLAKVPNDCLVIARNS
jgi:hypothetical protein